MITRRIRVLVAGIGIALCCQAVYGQGSSSVILAVDVENLVNYSQDTSDLSKFATDPNVTIRVEVTNFKLAVVIADIVAVNGQPAKGTLTRSARDFVLNTAPNPGRAIADTVRGALFADTFEILKSDGTPIGTIVSYGPSAGSPAPGAPLSMTQDNFAITGGTGAFLGARGQQGQAVTPQTIAARQASITEDPANRRRYGGGRLRFVLQVIPLFRPEVIVNAGFPAIIHPSNSAPVNLNRPALRGEILSALVIGLGPTRPGVDPGQPFPASPPPVVNSPVEVIVNGSPAEVLSAVGLPGSVEVYQVDFRVPSDAATGPATIQVSAAWIAGPAVNIPVQ